MAKFQEWPEIQAYATEHGLQVIGVDEAGRGPCVALWLQEQPCWAHPTPSKAWPVQKH